VDFLETRIELSSKSCPMVEQASGRAPAGCQTEKDATSFDANLSPRYSFGYEASSHPDGGLCVLLRATPVVGMSQ